MQNSQVCVQSLTNNLMTNQNQSAKIRQGIINPFGLLVCYILLQEGCKAEASFFVRNL